MSQQRRSTQSVVILPTLWSGPWIWREQRSVFEAAASNVVEIGEAVVNWASEPTLEAAEAYCLAQIVGLPTPWVLAGGSFGGLLALRLARHHPERISQVIACGCPGLGGNDELSKLLAGRLTLTFEEAKQARAVLFKDSSRVSDEEVRETIAAVAHRRGVRNGVRLLRTVREYDVSEDLRALRTPATLIWGELDRLTPLAPWRTLVETCPKVRLRVIAETGHVPMLESPAPFNAILRELLCGPIDLPS